MKIFNKRRWGLESWLASNKKAPPVRKRYFRAKAALDFLSAIFPKCFVRRDSRERVRALEVGIREKLFLRLENQLPKGLVLDDVRSGLRFYCRLSKYKLAKGRVGNPRINLDGEVVGEVTEDQVSFEALKKKMKRMRGVMFKARVDVPGFKVTLPLKPEQVPREILPPLGAPGSKKLKVFWDVALPGDKEQVYRVAFGVKNYRRAISAIDEYVAEGRDCVILLQGRLVGDFLIEDAGLAVQVRDV